MLCLIVIANLVSVVIGECFYADKPNLKLKCGDLAIKPIGLTEMTQLDAAKKCDGIDGQLINLDSEEKWKAMKMCTNKKWGNSDPADVWTGGVFKPNITDWGQLSGTEAPGAFYWSNGKPINDSDTCANAELTEWLTDVLARVFSLDEKNPVGVYVSNEFSVNPIQNHQCLTIENAELAQVNFDFICECKNAP